MSEMIVRPFAFMRLTHDAVRAGMSEVTDALEALEREPGATTLAALRDRFAAVRGCIDLHAEIEERAFFPLLDERFDGAAASAGFLEEHATDAADHAAIEAAFEACGARPDAETARAVGEAVRGWVGRSEAHLVHEEEVMMPLTERVHETLEGRAAAVGTLIGAIPADALEGTLLPYVLTKLEATKPFGPVRMFVEAVKLSTGPERFASIAPVCRAHLGAGTVAQLEGCGTL